MKQHIVPFLSLTWDEQKEVLKNDTDFRHYIRKELIVNDTEVSSPNFWNDIIYLTDYASEVYCTDWEVLVDLNTLTVVSVNEPSFVKNSPYKHTDHPNKIA